MPAAPRTRSEPATIRNTLAAALAATLMTGAAAARTPPPAAAKTSAAKSAKAPAVRTAKSLDCSKQADAKGLHGKSRKSFMSGCKKA